MKRDFNKWLETFRSSICDYKFYVDFEKVYGKVDNIKVELNILNSLIGSKNIENDFKNLVAEYPKVLKCIAYRISKTTNNHDSTINANFDYEFAKIFNPRVIYFGNKKSKAISVFSYIARSTQWRPRDFIKYIKICAEEACSMGMKYATNEIVKSADAKFSDYLKQEIIDEIFPVLPEINKILSLFSSIRKQSFNPSIFIEEYNKEIEKGNIKKISAENVLGTLFNYNVIGNIPSMKGQVLYKYAFKDARFNLNENIIVHRGLYKALQIF